MKQEFPVAFGAENGRINHINGVPAKLRHTGTDPLNRDLMRFRIAHDSSLANSFTTRLKLRLDQDHCFQRSLQPYCGDDGRQYQRRGNERHIHGQELNLRGQFAGRKLAGIGALHKSHTWIAAELFGNLTVARIHCEHARGSVLEHAVGEASGGRTDIKTIPVAQLDLPVEQRGFELQAASAHVAEIITQQADSGGFGNAVAGLLNLLLIHENAAGKDQRVCTLAAGDKSALEKQFVQTEFRHPSFGSHLYSIALLVGYSGINKMPDGYPNPKAPAPRTFGSEEDASLLSAIQSGNQDAMAAFFDRYSKMVYSVALRVLNDSGEAEDVMQEIFIQIWQNPAKFSAERGSMGGWLVVVARNRAIDKLRRRKPSDPVEMFALPSSVNLDRESERELLLEQIRTAMEKLPIEQRRSVELAFFDGLSHSEIADRTGEPLGTVKTRIRLALIAIRKELSA